MNHKQEQTAANSRDNLANDVLAAYEFGEGVTVVEQDNWNTDDPTDYTKIVYVAYDDDAANADSHKVSFHVRFTADGFIDDAYALEMEGGNDIGSRGDIVAMGREEPSVKWQPSIEQRNDHGFEFLYVNGVYAGNICLVEHLGHERWRTTDGAEFATKAEAKAFVEIACVRKLCKKMDDAQLLKALQEAQRHNPATGFHHDSAAVLAIRTEANQRKVPRHRDYDYQVCVDGQ